jgi:hypothetical protein
MFIVHATVQVEQKISIFCHLKFVQNGWWVGLSLKTGHFEIKMALGFISFTFYSCKINEIVTYFFKALNKTQWSKLNSF